MTIKESVTLNATSDSSFNGQLHFITSNPMFIINSDYQKSFDRGGYNTNQCGGGSWMDENFDCILFEGSSLLFEEACFHIPRNFTIKNEALGLKESVLQRLVLDDGANFFLAQTLCGEYYVLDDAIVLSYRGVINISTCNIVVITKNFYCLENDGVIVGWAFTKVSQRIYSPYLKSWDSYKFQEKELLVQFFKFYGSDLFDQMWKGDEVARLELQRLLSLATEKGSEILEETFNEWYEDNW